MRERERETDLDSSYWFLASEERGRGRLWKE